MIKIAVIGGIGCGKSKASKILEDLGYPVFDCDKIYKDITCTQEYLTLVEKTFPNSVKDGILDREYLGQLVFSDKSKLELLNSIAHPLVEKALNELIEKEKASKVFIEVQVLNENLISYFDKFLYITADMKYRIKRVMERSGYTKDYTKRIIAMQPDEKYYESLADYIIINNKGENELKSQLIKIL